MIDDAIKTLVRADSGITAIFSTRTYPITLPQQSTLPGGTWQRISTTRGLHHGGPNNVAQSLFQFTAYATDPLVAKQGSDAFRRKFHGFAGTVGDVKIHVARVVDERDFYDPDVALGIYQSSIDVEFTHSE